jgi:hypothetical protein
VKVEDGELVDGDNRVGRPEYWTVARLFGLLEEVEAKKKELNGPRMKPRVPWMHKTRKSGMAKDLDALRLLAKSDGEHDPRVRTLQVRLNEAKNLKRRVDEEIAVLKKIANQIGK